MNNFYNKCYHITRDFRGDGANEQDRNIAKLLQFLLSQNYDNTVLNARISRHLEKVGVPGVSTLDFAIEYPVVKLSGKNSESCPFDNRKPFSRNMKKYLLSHHQQVDLLHIHCDGRIACQAALTARKFNIPYLVSIYPDSGYSASPKRDYPLAKIIDYGRIFDYFYGKQFLKHAAAIICYDEKKIPYLRQTFPSKPIIKSYLGIDLEEQKLIGKRDFRKKYNIPINAEVILYEADFCHDCGQLKLIDLAEKLNSQFLNTHILLIGKVKSDTYLQEMKEKLAALQLNKVVTIIKDLPSDSEELVAAYQTADYCVIPAVSFLPYKTIFKAWANRLPVICPRREDVEELFQQKNYGLLYEEDDTDKLIESLSYLRGNSGYRVRLIQNSYDYLKKNFSWQSIGQDIVSLYQNLIGRSLK